MHDKIGNYTVAWRYRTLCT